MRSTYPGPPKAGWKLTALPVLSRRFSMVVSIVRLSVLAVDLKDHVAEIDQQRVKVYTGTYEQYVAARELALAARALPGTARRIRIQRSKASGSSL